MSNFIPIVTFVLQEDYTDYHEEFNQTVQNLLSDNGWVHPQLSNANITTLTAVGGLGIPVASQWYNSDTNKMQIMTVGGIETITSA